MEINGPLKISVVEQSQSTGWMLQVEFREDFQQKPVEERALVFSNYHQELQQAANTFSQGDRNLQGVLLVLQFVEQLLPYIGTDDIDLSATIDVQIQKSAAVSITELLKNE